MNLNGVIYDKMNKFWGSIQPESYKFNTKMLCQVILNTLCQHDSKVAQINADNDVRMTYHQLWLKTIRAAQNLQIKGFQSGQTFSFMVNHDDNLVPIILASLCLGCPINALHPLLSKQELISVLMKTKPSVIFCASNEYHRIEEVLIELKFDIKLFIFDETINGIESVESLFVETGIENQFVPKEVDVDNDIAAIFCSSGTTGPAKCLGISYGLLVPWIIAPHDFRADGVVLCFDSAYWSIGMYVILACIKSGATRIITNKSYGPELQLKIMQKYAVTTLYSGIFQLIACVKNELISKTNLSNVNHIYSYGAKVPFSLVTDAKRFFPNAKLTSFYGMTELGIVSQCPWEQSGNFIAGRIVDNCIAKIIDENGENCGPNVNGELCVKKTYKFLGYLDDAILNAAAIDSNGFMKTGDIGYFDDNGILCIKDRKKNSILNVFYFRGMILPAEIEECLNGLADVEQVCVVGVPATAGSELPAAVIVLKANSQLNQRDIYNVVADHFPQRSRLRAGVYFMDSLPKLPSGKPDRRKIIELATNLFQTAKDNDLTIKSFLSDDIPEEFRKLI